MSLPHSIQQVDKCPKPSLQTFVDDIMCTIRRIENIPLQNTIVEAINIIESYMNANKLSLNRDKTQLMVLNKDPPLKSSVKIQANPKDITPKETLTFLGVILSEKNELEPIPSGWKSKPVYPIKN